MPPPRPALQHWPLFSLTLTTPRLELRLPWPDDIVARSVFSLQWKCLGKWSADDWQLPLAVFADGQPVGLQDISADNFACVREVKTGSWLGLDYQGRGYGTEMRAAVLHLAFAGLGAQTARSEAFPENPASNAVSRRLGYREDGTEAYAVQERRRISQRYVVDRPAWERHTTVRRRPRKKLRTRVMTAPLPRLRVCRAPNRGRTAWQRHVPCTRGIRGPRRSTNRHCTPGR